MSTDDTRPDLPGGHGHAQDRPGPSSPDAGDLPAPARRAAEAAYRGWRIGDDGEGRLHAALVAAAPLIRAEAEARLAEIEAHASAIVDALRHALSYVEHVPDPSSQAAAERYRNALAIISAGQEPS